MYQQEILKVIEIKTGDDWQTDDYWRENLEWLAEGDTHGPAGVLHAVEFLP